MNTGISTKLPASDQVVVPVMFTPEKTGYYFVDVENGSVSSVQYIDALNIFSICIQIKKNLR